MTFSDTVSSFLLTDSFIFRSYAENREHTNATYDVNGNEGKSMRSFFMLTIQLNESMLLIEWLLLFLPLLLLVMLARALHHQDLYT